MPPDLPPEAFARPATLQALDDWAAFARVLAIYPPTNSRVLETLERWMGSLEAALVENGAESLEVAFGAERVWIDGRDQELLTGTPLFWIHERLEKSLLAGVRFERGFTRPGLIDFTRALIANFKTGRRDTTFEQLWPRTFPGLHLLDRRFEGTFSTANRSEAEAFRSWGARGKDEGQNQGGDQAQLDEDLAHLADVLARNAEVLERMDRIQVSLSSTVEEGEDSTTRGLDLIGRIVRLMPVDKLQDFPKALEWTTRVLEDVAERARRAGQRTSAMSDRDLNVLLYEVGQAMFSRTGPDAAEPEPEPEPVRKLETPAARGHAGDEAIHDDFEAFVQELEALPSDADRPAATEVGNTAEQLGVYLHLLVNVDDLDLEKIVPRIARLLSQVGPAEKQVLDAYLETLRPNAESQLTNPLAARLIDVLERAGMTALLREVSILSPESIVEHFPLFFVPYLDSLNLEHFGGHDELVSVCTQIGDARIVAAGPELSRRQGLLRENRPAKILGTAAHALASLARVILAEGGEPYREAVVRFVRDLKLQRTETCLLWFADDASFLAHDYLLGLLDPAPGPQTTAKLHKWVSLTLCRFIEDSAGDSDRLPRRLKAIQYLDEFMTREAHELLTVLVTPRLLIFYDEPKVVRKAARAVLDRHHGF